MRNPLRLISEQVIQTWPWVSISGIRSSFRTFGTKFWPTHPSAEGTVVNYDFCRSLYRNSGDNMLGAGFAKPIVDLQVGFIGIPTASTDNEAVDNILNECLKDFWTKQIQEMFRDSLRDSKIVARLSKPDIFDPLMTIAEAEHCTIELLPPERVEIERNFRNRRVIDRAVIHHRFQIVMDSGDPTTGMEPRVEEHDVLEIIDRDRYRFFDQNTNEWMDELETANTWDFVPLLEVFNEWDSALQSGQSEFESVVPFINAFHDVLTQGLQAHGYHSTPKLKLKLSDVIPFIRNNFPSAIDPATGGVIENAEVSWTGREVLFFNTTEDGEFLEARSILGDTKTLLEFLLDCICIASETPEWAFMRVDSGSANSDRNAQTVPFVKKIDRKRINYAEPIQELLKMIQVVIGQVPVRPTISWEVVRSDDNLILMQAFQQLVMGLEVAAQRGEISDTTYRETIRRFLPVMKSPQQEATDAAKNVQPAIPGNQPVPAIAGGPQGGNE